MIKRILSIVLLVSMIPCGLSVAGEEQDSFTVNVVGEGRDMILIPGLMSDQRTWVKLVAPLAENYRLHLVNIAGFSGHSPMPEPDFARVREELLRYIADHGLSEPIVVGHSLGGFMGLWLSTVPVSPVAAVISIDGLPFYAPTITSNSDTRADDMIAQARQFEAFYASLSSEQIVQASRQNMYIQTVKEENIPLILDMVEGADGKTVGRAIATLMTTDLRQALKEVDRPILLLGGGGRAAGTEYEGRMREIYQGQIESVPNATLSINWEAGHFINLDDPEWVLAQIRGFLESL